VIKGRKSVAKDEDEKEMNITVRLKERTDLVSVIPRNSHLSFCVKDKKTRNLGRKNYRPQNCAPITQTRVTNLESV
jgi:hypothetical protein